MNGSGVHDVRHLSKDNRMTKGAIICQNLLKDKTEKTEMFLKLNLLSIDYIFKNNTKILCEIFPRIVTGRPIL